jgi:alpha-1,2-mannosyltransferase
VRRLQRLAPWTVLAFMVGGSISWIRRPGDFAGYVLVGNLVVSGQDIYRDSPPGLNTWPPLFSLLCVPLAVLARPTPYLARGVWLALNFALLWVTLKGLVRLVYHAELRLQPATACLSLATPEVLLPLLLCYRFILGNFDHLQVNIVIFACAVAGLYWHARGHDLRAGALLGLAAALKIMPVLFVPYFVYRRRFRIAAATAVATAALSLFPMLIYGWQRFLDYVGAWRQALAVGWGVGKMNQSVYAMLDRFIGHRIRPGHTPVLDVLPDSGDRFVQVVMVAVLAGVAAVACWSFRGREPADSPASLAEYSVIFIVSALFGPLAWKAYLVVLLCPCMLLVALLRRGHLGSGERRGILAALGIYFVLSGLTTPGLLGTQLAGTLEMLSVTTVATLTLLLVVLWLRLRVRSDNSGRET